MLLDFLSGGNQTNMSDSIWKPHVTVAAMIEQHGKFLVVREMASGNEVINQPAGHLEENESLLEAVIRETLEETQYEFTPTGLQGIYRSISDDNPEVTYLRFLFTGEVGEHFNQALDEGIIAAEWLSLDEIQACQHRHRSPLVLQCIEDYLSQSPHSLNVISQLFA